MNLISQKTKWFWVLIWKLQINDASLKLTNYAKREIKFWSKTMDATYV